MTDLLAENFWVDGRVAKAPNVALINTTIPIAPQTGDFMIWGGTVFKNIGGWGMGIDVPVGVLTPEGVTSRVNGDLLIVNHGFPNAVFTLSGGVWNAGLALPTVAFYQPRGVAIAPDGTIHVVMRFPVCSKDNAHLLVYGWGLGLRNELASVYPAANRDCYFK